MGDNLPLIPEKESLCADVRPLLRAVFRELDYLPPLTTELPVPVAAHHLSSAPLADADHWIEKYNSECSEISRREAELKQQQARRVAREPLPNIHAPAPPRAPPPAPRWRLRPGLIERHHLVPTLQQNAARDGSLWIKNILATSSGDVSVARRRRSPRAPPPPRLAAGDDYHTVQTLSIGALEPRPPPAPAAPPAPAPPPDYIVCVPPQLDFVNFTVGHLHTQRVRLVNVSKFEIRLSVRPPARRELDVQLCGPRGLTVTSGAAAELRVHFRPSDVRLVRDELRVRVSMGRDFVVPIACYMQPPVLNILIPSVTSSLLSCSPGVERDEATGGVGAAGDVLELGARLLGDVHCARVLLHCDAEHASFFLLTEDAWLSYTLDCLSLGGSVVAGEFVVWPAWWGGGGAVRGCAWCRARAPGLHAAALRALSSTAVARPLHLLADVLLFRQDHLTILAHDKDYDICGEGEPACEYYVQLGTAFPRRALAATVQLVNHSPVVYSYYWSVRPWGECSCWTEDAASDAAMCDAALDARDEAQENRSAWERRGESAALVLVEPARGAILPRATCALHVRVPDVGARLGLQRAVLMLILKGIPRESFPPDYEPMIVSTEEVETESIPGVESERREVCEVVCAQMEVWWDVVPLRFVLLPPVVPLHHSRRRESVSVELTATQLFGVCGARVAWRTPTRVPPPAPLQLAPAQHCSVALAYPLPGLPNHFPETDLITLVAENAEWQAQCVVRRQCSTRHPSLRPARAWLGVVPPAARMHHALKLHNDTHEKIWWWAEAFRWWGENEPSRACRGRLPCERCQERACTCALLRPATGALAHDHAAEICYDVNAPERDGCVATLVRVRRPGADVAHAGSGTGDSARAALVAYRVLAPRLVLRVLPCNDDTHTDDCTCFAAECGAEGGARGAALLRPRAALALGRRTCYRLRLTNITPLPTAVHFDNNTEDSEVLKVKFNPSEFRVRPYAEVEVRVSLLHTLYTAYCQRSEEDTIIIPDDPGQTVLAKIDQKG
nr:uncharacterized protein LOC110379716 [Helicoverpa armigera]